MGADMLYILLRHSARRARVWPGSQTESLLSHNVNDGNGAEARSRTAGQRLLHRGASLPLFGKSRLNPGDGTASCNLT